MRDGYSKILTMTSVILPVSNQQDNLPIVLPVQ